MSEKKMELTPLKIRSHGALSVMQYDERYTPYIEMTRLLPSVQLDLPPEQPWMSSSLLCPDRAPDAGNGSVLAGSTHSGADPAGFGLLCASHVQPEFIPAMAVSLDLPPEQPWMSSSLLCPDRAPDAGNGSVLAGSTHSGADPAGFGLLCASHVQPEFIPAMAVSLIRVASPGSASPSLFPATGLRARRRQPHAGRPRAAVARTSRSRRGERALASLVDRWPRGPATLASAAAHQLAPGQQQTAPGAPRPTSPPPGRPKWPRTIFADGTGKNAPWMWLKALTVFDHKFSWGSAALAYLYRWTMLVAGRQRTVELVVVCSYFNNPVRQPTWAYKWDLVSEVASEVNLLYKQYTNEMDLLTLEQVEWEPYGVGPNFGDAHTFDLNPLCVQERHLWLMRCPLICNWVVEFHLPHRVMHQFGYFQPHPPEWVDTDTQLHRLDRRRQRKIKDWQKHHKSYVISFEQSVHAASSIRRTQYRQHCPLAFNNYVRWFQESTRVEICPPAYEEDILEEPTEYDALAQDHYNKLIREGYQTSFAPVLNFVEQGQKLRRLSNILGCRDPEYVSPSRSGSSERNTLDDSASSGARMDDGDITSAANTQRNTVEDDVDTPEVADGMTLKAFQRSAYMFVKDEKHGR
ncbi:hypothetical protein D1007_49206 [Hordeum vulgare]|nr:hypothetical protein D1007_49206 [Hordeum vulgare]